MRLQIGVPPARQGIKIQGGKNLIVVVTEERSSSPVPSPVSTKLTSQQSATFSNKSLRLQKDK